MSYKKHMWSKDEIQSVIDTTLVLSNTDENEANLIMASDIGVTKGAIKALRISLSRIAMGFEPTPLTGGPGHNWGKNVEVAFNDWFDNHDRYTKRQLSNKI